jgi:hypothetical protein
VREDADAAGRVNNKPAPTGAERQKEKPNNPIQQIFRFFGGKKKETP